MISAEEGMTPGWTEDQIKAVDANADSSLDYDGPLCQDQILENLR
jgi:hypothetical protein